MGISHDTSCKLFLQWPLFHVYILQMHQTCFNKSSSNTFLNEIPVTISPYILEKVSPMSSIHISTQRLQGSNPFNNRTISPYFFLMVPADFTPACKDSIYYITLHAPSNKFSISYTSQNFRMNNFFQISSPATNSFIWQILHIYTYPQWLTPVTNSHYM